MNIQAYKNYFSFVKTYERTPQLDAYERSLFAQLGHSLPPEINVRNFATKARLYKVTMEHVDTLKQNQTKQILLGIFYTLITLSCLALLIGGFSAPFLLSGIVGIVAFLSSLFAFDLAIAFSPLYLLVSFFKIEAFVKEQEMREAFGNLEFAHEVQTQEGLKTCINQHESATPCRMTLLFLLNCLFPFVYLYQACTAVSRWEKVLEKQKEGLTALVEHNNKLFAETRDYYGAHFHELDAAYSTKIQDKQDRSSMHALLQHHHKNYLKELANKVAFTDVLPSVLNNVVIDYL
jgi:hypothetical protein